MREMAWICMVMGGKKAHFGEFKMTHTRVHTRRAKWEQLGEGGMEAHIEL